ncbi:transglutaminase domain protein [Desulfosarcina variabilis str. Montpellier]|uniref:transglutaminase-like domain-containing protein n=1 Tax=Desulfosarcina variabilis TaxID=2300 RepID=UPI003AFA8C7E
MKTITTGSTLSTMLIASDSGSAGHSAQDHDEERIESTVKRITRGAETDAEKMKRIYYFVRDEIKFGWIYPQEIPAQKVLKNRRGVCMQKANLLVAMAREAGLKARFHFMYVHKTALDDFLPQFAYKRWIDPFPHAFPEVYLIGKWVSMEATFDQNLHEICISKKLNFGKNASIVKDVSIEFSIDGVKGHQQYVHAKEKASFYGEDLSGFSKFMHVSVPFWKRMLQPFIFKKAQKIIDQLRSETKG